MAQPGSAGFGQPSRRQAAGDMRCSLRPSALDSLSSAVNWLTDGRREVIGGRFATVRTIPGPPTGAGRGSPRPGSTPVSYTHLRAHETDSYFVCRLLLEKKT